MRRAGIIALLLLVAVAGQAEITQDIQGAWELSRWTYLDGTFETPGSLGYTMQLQFSADGTFLRYRDYVLEDESVWDISYAWVQINGSWVHVEFLATGVGDSWEPGLIIPGAVLELRTGFGNTYRTETYYFIGPVSSDTETWGAVKALYRN